jgi:hypothetical protein
MACRQGLPDPGLVKRVASCLRPAMSAAWRRVGRPGLVLPVGDRHRQPIGATTTAWVALVPGELAEELALGEDIDPRAEGTRPAATTASPPSARIWPGLPWPRAYTVRPAWLRPLGEET